MEEARIVNAMNALLRYEAGRNAGKPEKQQGVCETIFLLRHALGLRGWIPGGGIGIEEAFNHAFEDALEEVSNIPGMSEASMSEMVLPEGGRTGRNPGK